MKRWLQRFGLWLAKWGGWVPPPPIREDIWGIPLWIDGYVRAAKPLVTAIESTDESGEWKRHQVYARLIKMFPQAVRRDLGLAIELALLHY